MVLALESGIISHKFCRIIVCWYVSQYFFKFVVILMFLPLRLEKPRLLEKSFRFLGFLVFFFGF